MIKKSLKKNYIYNLLYQILLLVTPLITTPYVSRVLGADGIGTVSYAESIVSYFTLFATMGITIYGQREISYVQDSLEERSVIFWNIKLLSFFTVSISLIIYIAMCFIKCKPLVYLILSFNILSVLGDVTWFFQGLEEFGKIVLRNVIFKIINIMYIFLVVKTKEDIIAYVVGISLFGFISNLSLWGYLPRYITKIRRQNLRPFKDIKVIISLFLPTIAVQVYTVLDKTMIGMITQDAFENGYYEQALKISKMVLTIVTALGTVMIPRIGYHFQKREQEIVKHFMYRGYRFVWMFGVPLCIGLVMTADNFVPWFFGGGYNKVAILLKILAFLIIAIGISNVTGMQYLIPTKRQNIVTCTVIIGACTNFVMNIILIQKFQSIGAAVSSVVAESVVSVVQILIMRKELSPVRILKEGIHYFIAGIIMGGGLKFLGDVLHPSIYNTAILVVSGAIIYFSVLVIMRDEFLLLNMKKVLHYIKY